MALCLLWMAPSAFAGDSAESAGDVLTAVLPLSAVAMTFAKDGRHGRLQFARAFASTVATTGLLKYSIDKERPDGEDHAFPSGHSALAFSAASFLQRRYGWHFGSLAYLCASYVGWSRVEADAHDWEDVVAGASIGVAFSYLFAEPLTGKTQMSPIISDTLYGLAFSRRW